MNFEGAISVMGRLIQLKFDMEGVHSKGSLHCKNGLFLIRDKTVYHGHLKIFTNKRLNIITSTTHNISSIKHPITSTGPHDITRLYLITSVTCGSTNIFIRKNSIISHFTTDHSISRISEGSTVNCMRTT